MKKRLPAQILILALFVPSSALAWNATGHQLVARIAWEQMNDDQRQRAISILRGAPQDACLLELFPNSGSQAERERDFFVRSSTWADIVRPDTTPGVNDTRACTRFHRGDWHFINFFWRGISGATNNNRPRDLTPQELKRIKRPDINAVVLLDLFQPFIACSGQQCGTAPEDRAITLAWILHLVGDIHQPLHTSARVNLANPNGDQGGNLCKIAKASRSSLHSFWDGIVDIQMPKPTGESTAAYIERVANLIMQEHPRSGMSDRLQPFDFDAWSREGLETTKNQVYPFILRCDPNVSPNATYRGRAFTISKEAIALAGYRLAELLNQLFGS